MITCSVGFLVVGLGFCWFGSCFFLTETTEYENSWKVLKEEVFILQKIFIMTLQKLVASTTCCLQRGLVLPRLWFWDPYWKSRMGENNTGEERHLLAPFISAVICQKNPCGITAC